MFRVVIVTDRFGALIPNNGCWSSSASGNLEVLAQNLTFGVSSNQAAAKLLITSASNMRTAGPQNFVEL
jgi:hypothetical protein